MMTGNKARNKIHGRRPFIIREPLGADMGCAGKDEWDGECGFVRRGSLTRENK
jgi:hypothetical protein